MLRRRWSTGLLAAVLACVVSEAGASVIQVTETLGDYNDTPVISGNGRLVAFVSTGDLGGLNPDGIDNIFVYDVVLNKYYRATGAGAAQPSISRDGRYIVFTSTANYTFKNIDGSDEIFRVDWARKRFRQISMDRMANGSSFTPVIAGSGRRTVFQSSSNLLGQNPDFSNEIFVRRGGNRAVSRDTEGFGESYSPTISHDGRFVAFITTSDLKGHNEDASPELMLYDVRRRTLTQLTNDPFANGESYSPAISGDGRFITFVSYSNIAGLNPDGFVAVWIRSKATGDFSPVTISAGTLFDADVPTISEDGRWIAMTSTYNITGGNPDGSTEILLYDRVRKTFRQLTDGPASCSSSAPKISADGTRVTYLSDCDPLGTNADGNAEIFAVDNPALNLVVHVEGNATVIVTDPEERAIFAGNNSIPGARFETGDFDGDTVPEIRVTIVGALEGTYQIFLAGAPGSESTDPVTVDGTLNALNVELANGTVGTLSGTMLRFSNQGFKHPSSRVKPLVGLGSRIGLRAGFAHPRATSGNVMVLFNDGLNEQRFDFPPIETFTNGRYFSGMVDGFTTTVYVRGSGENSSISLRALKGDLTEFAGSDDVNMTVAVRIGPNTDMYNWRYRRAPLTGTLTLR